MKPLRTLTIAMLIFGTASVSKAQNQSPSVLLISFDGFRHDYIDKHDLKNFKEFRANGSAAEGLIPVYPSLTFPNHYSIVTGMYPGSHGLVDNTFYDSIMNVVYTISNRELVANAKFYGGTPLWTLAKNAGLKTASYFWVGSEVTDPARRPDKFFLYDANVSFTQRVDSVLSWLNKSDKERPRLVTLYFNEPDHVSHETGPNSPETHQQLLVMDSVLGYLANGLKKVKAPVNTIIVSDHGMAEMTAVASTYIFLDEIYDVKSNKVRTIVSGTGTHLYIDNKTTLDSMYTLLKAKQDRFKVYKKNELPSHIHINHYRTGDLVLIAEPYKYFRYGDRAGAMQRMKLGSHFGVHGFDPSIVTDVRGIFLAQGPNIRKGQQLGLVKNIDVYPLVTKILGLQNPKIDGDPRALEKIYVGKK